MNLICIESFTQCCVFLLVHIQTIQILYFAIVNRPPFPFFIPYYSFTCIFLVQLCPVLLELQTQWTGVKTMLISFGKSPPLTEALPLPATLLKRKINTGNKLKPKSIIVSFCCKRSGAFHISSVNSYFLD